MAVIKISERGPSILMIKFPSHASRHEITPGPITLITFGETAVHHFEELPLDINVPNEHAILEVRDCNKRLICSWEQDHSATDEGPEPPNMVPKIELDSASVKQELQNPPSNHHSTPRPRPPATTKLIAPYPAPSPTSTARRTMGYKVPRPRRPPQPQIQQSDSSNSSNSSESSDCENDGNLRHKLPVTVSQLSVSQLEKNFIRRPSNAVPKRVAKLAANTQHLRLAQRPPVISTTTPVSDTQRFFLTKVINHIKEYPEASEFRAPVDYIGRRIPNYSSIITDPMDLGTIALKLSSKEDSYTSLSTFLADFDLMVHNAATFNGEYHEVSKDAKVLKRYLDGYLARFASQEVGTLEVARLLFAQGPKEAEPRKARETTVTPEREGGRQAHPRTSKRKIDYAEPSIEDLTLHSGKKSRLR